MEKLDLLILGELGKDAQASFAEIAKKLGTSPYTTRTRYKKMTQERTILRCTVNIDLSKLGYQGKLLLLITLSPQQAKNETISALKKIRNIITVTEIIGAFDLLAIAPITDFDSIKALVDAAKGAPHVERVEIACIVDTGLSPLFGKVLSRTIHELATT